MGCGSSVNKVAVVGTSSPEDLPRSPSKKIERPRSRTVRVLPKAEGDVVVVSELAKRGPRLLKRRGKQQGWQGSQTSLQDSEAGGDGQRGVSASSKTSHHSTDSGFADTSAECRNFVTELSESDQIKQVEDSFHTPRNLDLTLNGTACPQRSSAKNKERLDEQRVIARLREEGLIARPVSSAPRGLAFEIVAEGTGMFGADRRPPPIRLEKLEKRRKKKKRLTEEQIQAKMVRAEERKREREQQRLAKIQSLHKSDKTDVQNALDSFADRQHAQDEGQKSKEQQVEENRERRLKDVRDKLRAKQEHAEAVRRRKKLTSIQIPDSPRNGASSVRSTDGRPDGLNPIGYGLAGDANI